MERFVFTCTPPGSKRSTFGLLGNVLQERFRDESGHHWRNSSNSYALDYGLDTLRTYDALEALFG